jgi:hypothetical protein
MYWGSFTVKFLSMLYDFLKLLHSTDNEDVLAGINQATYSENFENNSELIHTGFIYKIFSGKSVSGFTEMCIFYDFVNQQLLSKKMYPKNFDKLLKIQNLLGVEYFMTDESSYPIMQENSTLLVQINEINVKYFKAIVTGRK